MSRVFFPVVVQLLARKLVFVTASDEGPQHLRAVGWVRAQEVLDLMPNLLALGRAAEADMDHGLD